MFLGGGRYGLGLRRRIFAQSIDPVYRLNYLLAADRHLLDRGRHLFYLIRHLGHQTHDFRKGLSRRIDHFRAFASYWAVDAQAETAKVGQWLPGPGMKLFDKVFEVYPNAPIIAEDLGVFGEDVVQLLADTGFPGMKVVQFGFDPNGDSSHMPHNAEKNSINYVGTHDNNTLLGWLWEAGEAERRFALDYAGFTGDNWGDGGYQSPACRKIIETVWRSASNVVIIALQDMCGFGSDARMNTPGVPEKNWRFRTTEDTIANIDGAYFRRINSLFRRTYPVFEK